MGSGFELFWEQIEAAIYPTTQTASLKIVQRLSDCIAVSSTDESSQLVDLDEPARILSYFPMMEKGRKDAAFHRATW
jgi:hypothetical protein